MACSSESRCFLARLLARSPRRKKFVPRWLCRVLVPAISVFSIACGGRSSLLAMGDADARPPPGAGGQGGNAGTGGGASGSAAAGRGTADGAIDVRTETRCGCAANGVACCTSEGDCSACLTMAGYLIYEFPYSYRLHNEHPLAVLGGWWINHVESLEVINCGVASSEDQCLQPFIGPSHVVPSLRAASCLPPSCHHPRTRKGRVVSGGSPTPRA
jgi:hypothetical protein